MVESAPSSSLPSPPKPASSPPKSNAQSSKRVSLPPEPPALVPTPSPSPSLLPISGTIFVHRDVRMCICADFASGGCGRAIATGNVSRHIEVNHRIDSANQRKLVKKTVTEEIKSMSGNISILEPYYVLSFPKDRSGGMKKNLDGQSDDEDGGCGDGGCEDDGDTNQSIPTDDKANDGEEHNPLPLIAPSLHGLPIVACIACPQPECRFIHNSSVSLRKHWKINHSSHGSPPSEFEPCYGQTLFIKSRALYFKVFPPVAPRPTPATGSLEHLALQVTLGAAVQGSSGPQDETNIRFMGGFISKARLDRDLQAWDTTMDEAFDLAKVDHESDEYKRCLKITFDYLDAAYRHQCKHSYIVTRHEIQGHSCDLSLQAKTLHKYAKQCARFIYFISKADASSPPAASSSAARPPSKAGRFHDASLAALKDMLICRVPKPVLESRRILHDVLQHALMDGFGENPVAPRFIAHVAVLHGAGPGRRSFASSSSISPILAGIKYLVRVHAVMSVFEYHNGDSTEISWSRVDSRISASIDNGASCVEGYLRVAFATSCAEGGNVVLSVCEAPAHNALGCLLVGTEEISLRNLGSIVKDCEDRATALMDMIVRNETTPADFYRSLVRMPDDMMDRMPGGSFLNHPKNRTLVISWTQRAVDACQSTLYDDQGMLRPVAARGFLRTCRTLRQLFIGQLQIGSGAPARSTELGTLRVYNTPTAQRNIFLVGGHVVLVPDYQKSRALNDGAGKAIARFPSAVTSGLLLRFIIFVLPVEAAIVAGLAVLENGDAGEVDKSAVAANHASIFFSTRGQPMSEDAVRDGFSWVMSHVGGYENIKTANYRHLQVGMLKNFGDGPSFDEIVDFQDDAAHVQAGHSTKTGLQRYGATRGFGEFTSFSAHRFHAFKKASASWCAMIGLPFGPPISPSARPHDLVAGPARRSPPAVIRNDNGNNVVCVGCVAGIQRVADETFQINRHLHKLNDIDAVRPPPIGDNDNAMLWRMASTVLGRAITAWTCDGQEALVRFSLGATSRHAAMLACTATGSGKSLAFLMAASVPGKMTIVVSPLLVVMDDILRKCRESGISAGGFDQRNAAGIQLVVISVEKVASPEYAQFLTNQVNRRALDVMFADEVHLAVMWRGFRPVMESLAECLVPRSLPTGSVRVVALTATAPPSVTPTILDQLGISAAVVIRSPSARPNIKYVVKRVSQEGMTRAAALEATECFQEDLTGRAAVILFCNMTVEAESLADSLRAKMIATSVLCYHGKLDDAQRAAAFAAFMTSTVQVVVVATSALGAGVDNPNVQRVVMVGPPPDIMSFDQGAGRAGRFFGQGKPAVCVTLVQEESPTDDDGWVKHKKARITEQVSFGDMTPFLDAALTGICRRLPLADFLDVSSPVLQPAACRAMTGAVLCDVCEMGMTTNRTQSASPITQPSRAKPPHILPNPAPTPLLHVQPLGTNSPPVRPHPRPFRAPLGQAQHAPASSGVVPTVNRRLAMKNEIANDGVAIAQFLTLCGDLKSYCAPCWASSSSLITHGRTGRGACPLANGRCARCDGPRSAIHRAENCSVLPVPGRHEQRCRFCTLGRYKNSLPIHLLNHGFGSKACIVKAAVHLALACWRTRNFKKFFIREGLVPRPFETDALFAGWLTLGPNGEAGIIRLLPSIYAFLFDNA